MKSTFSLLLFLTSGPRNSTHAQQVEIDAMYTKCAIAKGGIHNVQFRKNPRMPLSYISVEQAFLMFQSSEYESNF